MSPDPPYPGSTASFVVEAVADTRLESGTLDIGVSYHGFPIYTQSQDLCDATSCPVKKGPLTLTLEESFPIITPPGPYTVRLSAVGVDPIAPLLCLDVDFSVVPQSARNGASAE
ncbi:hypothetical protein WJX81_004847 [Elliptochloris bilobata]|uniref:MD-2-related lipid-recognition domain-containing protein n=1 Tax=Elliptochloris bilobata TaxID=381761 RepID=A0AAW1R1K2_9CHLO